VQLGDGRWILVDDKPSEGGGRVGLRIDVTDLKRAREAAEAAAKTKARFLSVMSDEVKSPLSDLAASLSLLQAEGLAPQIRKRLEHAREAGQSLQAVIDQILELSDLESGQIVLEEVEFETESLLGLSASLVQSKAAEKNLHLELTLDPLLPKRLRGDPVRIKQVIVNLLDNAIRFANRGVVSIALSQGDIIAPGRFALRCEVRDSATVDSSDVRSTLLNEVALSHPGSGRRVGGAGLGLAICARLIETMGGTIWFDSKDAAGSCFAFEIPVAGLGPEATGGGSALPTEPPALAAPGAEAAWVLAIEDNRMTRRLLRAYLRRMGVEVEIVSDGATALEWMRHRAFDLVLIDVSIAGLDAEATVAALRQQDGSHGRLPIVALSANIMPREVQRYLAAGIDDHLAKPLDPVRLAKTLSHWLPSKVRASVANADAESSGKVAPLEPAALQEVVAASGEALATELVGDFLTDLDRRIGSLVVAAGRLDRALLADESDAIASAAAFFGASEVHDLARLIKTEARDLTKGEAFRLTAELGIARDRVKAAYRQWRDGLSVGLDRMDGQADAPDR